MYKEKSDGLISDISYLIGSKLHSGFSFHQSCIYLHNDRLYGIGTAPALFSEEFHAQGPAAKYIAAEEQRTEMRN